MPETVIGCTRHRVCKKRPEVRGENPRIPVRRIVKKPDKRHGVIRRVYHRIGFVTRVI